MLRGVEIFATLKLKIGFDAERHLFVRICSRGTSGIKRHIMVQNNYTGGSVHA